MEQFAERYTNVACCGCAGTDLARFGLMQKGRENGKSCCTVTAKTVLANMVRPVQYYRRNESSQLNLRGLGLGLGDRPRLRARAMVSSRVGLGSVFTFLAPGPFLQADQI